MNNLDKQYTQLLQDIIDNGVIKKDRTGTGTISLFGRQIRHHMKDGFPLLTTKKMAWNSIVVELLWFLRGDTNIKYLVDNGCNIWVGDAYKNYYNHKDTFGPMTIEQFIEEIRTNDEFAKKWGDLGPVYGKQWRNWGGYKKVAAGWEHGSANHFKDIPTHDQIANLISDLNKNPDSRRLMVNAWNVGEIDQMVLPPCHYGFQVYTRELTAKERWDWYGKNGGSYGEVNLISFIVDEKEENNQHIHEWLKKWAPNVPTRAISLMWNQRSVDTFLGLPFNIASYGLLLEIIAKEVNMVPDELIGNLGDVHLYSNHIEQAKEQIGRELSLEERVDYWFHNNKPNRDVVDDFDLLSNDSKERYLNTNNIPKRTREPLPLTSLKFKTHLVVGPNNFNSIIDIIRPKDLILDNYQSHDKINAPLSN